MATVVGALNMSHAAITALPGEKWEANRLGRPRYRDNVPIEDEEEAIAKAKRSASAKQVLRDKFAELRPDALVVFGNDQLEMFDFTNYPSLSVFVGESFTSSDIPLEELAEDYAGVGHPTLATHVLVSLLSNGFDSGFIMKVPEGKDMCHAVMRPLTFLDAFKTPVVPVLPNELYAPQMTAVRCYELGEAVRDAIESFEEDIRVAAIGSGGLWHTPQGPQSWLNEEFDRECLGFLERGDVLGAARFFDSYVPSPDDLSQAIGDDVPRMTGMPAISGPQKGTREICSWFAALACAHSRPQVLIDYIPMYASPIGVAYGYSGID